MTLGDSDASGVDFTAFRTSARSSLTAAVPPEVPAHLRASIKAELLPATASGSAVPSSSPVGTAAVDGSGFFELRGVKQGSYVLRLSCAAPAAGLSCDPLTVPVQVCAGWCTCVVKGGGMSAEGGAQYCWQELCGCHPFHSNAQEKQH